MLDSASAGFVQSRQRRHFRVYVRRAPSPKFATLSISCERNIADGRRCQSGRKKGERLSCWRGVCVARSKRSLTRNSIAENKVPGTENTFLWNGNVYELEHRLVRSKR